MTCDEIREHFSALVDGRLPSGERAGLVAHLEGCAACRTDLERFRSTVALVRSIEPVRAPAGFAERVIASARPRAVTAPAPWWRRLVDRLLFPLPVKLPIEAAAIVLVGVGAAYLYQRTPELHEAARIESPARLERFASGQPSTGQSSTSTPAPSEAPPAELQSSRLAADSAASKGSPSSPAQSPVKERSIAAQRPASPPPVTERSARAEEQRQAEAPAATSDKKESADVRAKDSRVDATQPVPGAVAAPPVAAPAAPEPPRRVLRDAPREREQEAARPEGQLRQVSPPAAAQAPAAREPVSGATAQLAMKSAPPNVAGALKVGSPVTAASALRELTARHRGRIVGSREERDATIVDVRVPRDEYAGFVAGLNAIGSWRAERESGELPAEVGITVRLVQ